MCGTENNGSFEIWRMTYWTGIFYPVVKGKIDTENKKVKIDSISLNPAGKLIKYLLLGFLIYGLLVYGILNGPYEWKPILFKLIIGALIFVCYFSFFVIVSYDSKKSVIEELNKTFANIK